MPSGIYGVVVALCIWQVGLQTLYLGVNNCCQESNRCRLAFSGPLGLAVAPTLPASEVTCIKNIVNFCLCNQHLKQARSLKCICSALSQEWRDVASSSMLMYYVSRRNGENKIHEKMLILLPRYLTNNLLTNI